MDFSTTISLFRDNVYFPNKYTARIHYNIHTSLKYYNLLVILFSVQLTWLPVKKRIKITLKRWLIIFVCAFVAHKPTSGIFPLFANVQEHLMNRRMSRIRPCLTLTHNTKLGTSGCLRRSWISANTSVFRGFLWNGANVTTYFNSTIFNQSGF